MRTEPRRRPLRVIHSAPAPGPNASYVDQIVSDRIDDIEFDYFSWRKILTRHYDVLHVHWPEMLVRDVRHPLRAAMYALMLARLRLTGTRIVRTLHNVEPHETLSSLQRWLLDDLDRRTDQFIRLNPFTASPGTAPSALIPHGDYRRPFAEHNSHERQPGRILYFGLIRPYKGVEQLISAFARLEDPTATLHVVGRAKGDADASIIPLADADDRVSMTLRFVDDNELVAEISAAELIVLPYRRMHNSGSLFAALSLDRPVLAPTSETNRWIAEEVGSEWLMLYDGVLDQQTLADAVARTRRMGPTMQVGFADRSWDEISARHADVYRRVVAQRR